jgi:Tol biopolymer transport system component
MAACARLPSILARAALFASAALAVAVGPAHATHPGGNGALAFGAFSLNEESTDIDIDAVYVGIDPLRGRGRHIFAMGSTPSFSPDGRLIAYADADEYESSGISIASADCRRRVRGPRPRPCRWVRYLTFGEDVSPTWSPRGTRVAFERGYAQIYVTSVRHGGKRFLARGWDPDWSSRGVIAFSRPDFGGIRTKRPGAGRTRLLTHVGHSPSWAPSGRRLAFTLTDTAFAGLYVINADGTGLRRIWPQRQVIGGAASVAHAPAWSPDGRRIAFIEGDELFTGAIYSIRPDGRGLRRLSRPLADCRTCVEGLMFEDLSWQPRPSRR